MDNRVNTPFTNEHFAAYCLAMVGQPYWFGTCGYKATSNLLSRKSNQYPSHYGSSRSNQYKADINAKTVVADCIGGAKGYAWTGGGQAMLDAIGNDNAVANKYGSNGCPDKGAGGMFTYTKSKGRAWGSIDTLPEVIGLALYKSGHVGYYVGNGYAVEWKGFAYGCVKTKVAGRGWTHWYELPFINYNEDSDTTVLPKAEVVLGSRLLKKGMAGADVKALQELLLQLSYVLPKYGADGEFGSETEKAVIAFQKSEGLEQDGKYGDKTHAALMDAVADDEPEQADDATPPDLVMTDKPLTTSRKVVIVSEGGKVNIRSGNSSGYSSFTTVAPGTTFEHIVTAPNGWNAIVVGAQVGWVSGQYSKML